MSVKSRICERCGKPFAVHEIKRVKGRLQWWCKKEDLDAAKP